MTPFEKEYMEKQFAKAVKACEAVAKKRPYVKEFTVLKKDKFWATWAKANGYSSLVKKTHRFVAVLRLNFGGLGDICFSVSNREQPEIAALDVLKMAMVGWTTVPGSSDIGVFSNYCHVAKKNYKKMKKAEAEAKKKAGVEEKKEEKK